MTVGELRNLLIDFEASTHVAIVWPQPQLEPEGPWLAEIEKLLIVTEIGSGEIDLLLQAVEVVSPEGWSE